MSDTHIPESISSDALQSLLDTASEQDQAVDFNDDDALFLHAGTICTDAVEAATETRAAVMHKAMVTHIIGHMIEWHSLMGEEMIKAGQLTAADSWLKDAGKLQAIMNILITIKVDDTDFMLAV